MARDRDQLYITVPSLFQCPISHDVMKSPVSLCTGVTYDRSSIQHWLESGHDTCPATMQVLVTKDFVPNLTLHRLINLWAQSSTRRPDSVLSPSPAISARLVGVWVERIESGRADSLAEIAECLSYCEANRKFLVSFDGFIEAVAGVLTRASKRIQEMEFAIKILNTILAENGVDDKLNKLLLHRNCLSQFVTVLREGNLESKIGAVKLLTSISIPNESKRLVAETPDLVATLLHLLKTVQCDPALNDVVLTFLTSVIIIRTTKIQLGELGLVQVLARILLDKNAAVPAVEKSLKLLSSLSMVPEGRAGIREEPGCAEGIVERLMKVSKTATEDGVMVLWGMCCMFRDGRVQDKVVRVNGMMKILVVMQSVGEGQVRRMCGELIKVEIKGW